MRLVPARLLWRGRDQPAFPLAALPAAEPLSQVLKRYVPANLLG